MYIYIYLYNCACCMHAYACACAHLYIMMCTVKIIGSNTTLRPGDLGRTVTQ